MSRIPVLFVAVAAGLCACGGEVSVLPTLGQDASWAGSASAVEGGRGGAQGGQGGVSGASAGAQGGAVGSETSDASTDVVDDLSATDSSFSDVFDSDVEADSLSGYETSDGAEFDAAADAAVDILDVSLQPDLPDDVLLQDVDGEPAVDADADAAPSCLGDAPSGFTPVCPEYSCTACADRDKPSCAQICEVQACFYCEPDYSSAHWRARSVVCESGCIIDAGHDASAPDASSDATCSPPGCRAVLCNGTHLLSCGDCADNDGDGLVDMADPDCTGACDFYENDFAFPPGSSSPCKVDCYFDQGLGSGDDGCAWDLSCDPLAKLVPANPEPYCKYEPSKSAQCESWTVEQSPLCHALCEPLTPNGCDCFGCCEHPAGSGSFVYLGSTTWEYNPDKHCEAALLDDPARCHPCTPVPSCFNPCEGCELCFGMTALPGGCDLQRCPVGSQPCGLPCQQLCPSGEFCLSGCCMSASPMP